MILNALVAGGSAGVLVLVWQAVPVVVQRLAPAGSGLHRYAMTPTQLRAELARSDREMNDLVCAMATVSNERDRAVRVAWTWRHTAHKAADRIDELAEQAREAKQLRESNRALHAELANTRTIRPLLTDRSKEDTLPRGIPVITGAPYASTDPGRIRA